MTEREQAMTRHLAENVCQWQVIEQAGMVSAMDNVGGVWLLCDPVTIYGIPQFDPFHDASHCEMCVEAARVLGYRPWMLCHADNLWEVKMHKAEGTTLSYAIAQSESPSRLVAVCEAIARATGWPGGEK